MKKFNDIDERTTAMTNITLYQTIEGRQMVGFPGNSSAISVLPLWGVGTALPPHQSVSGAPSYFLVLL